MVDLRPALDNWQMFAWIRCNAAELGIGDVSLGCGSIVLRQDEILYRLGESLFLI